MTLSTKNIHDARVLYDDEHPDRWYDAWGPGVVKYVTDFVGIPTDNTTGMPTEYTNTLVGASTFAVTDVAGGTALITTAGAEDDGVKLQLGSQVGTAGENVSFAGAFPCYFGARFQIDDVTQSDVLLGVCVTDTACLDAVTDGMYFRCIDESAVLYFVLEKDSLETVTAVATLVNATTVQVEWLYDGTYVHAYINGVLMASVAATDANFPNDELMRLTVEFLTGEAGAHTCCLDYLRLIQVQR